MSHQFRLGNWNEDGSPSRDRDARALRYLLASNSSSSVAFNNRARSSEINDQVVHDNIMQTNPLHSTHIPLHSNTTNITTSHATNDSSPPRLFGSPLILAPTITRSSDGCINTSIGQLRPAPTITSTGIGNSSVKRSRSPDLVRGESSNQGSRVGGTLRRRTNPPPRPTFQQESVNNNNISSVSSTPMSTLYNYNGNRVFSDMLRRRVNQIGVSAAQNSITSESHIINRHSARLGLADFIDDTPSYNSPSQSIIDEDVARLLLPSRQENPRDSFTMPRTTEHASASLFQRNNNIFSFEAGSSSSSGSPDWGLNGFNNNHSNLDLSDFSRLRSDDTFVDRITNAQEYVRLLPGGRVSTFFAPSIVHVPSDSYGTRQPQRPSDSSTSSYRRNPLPPPPAPGSSTFVEYDQHMHTGRSLARSRNRRRGNNRILTSTSPQLRAQRNSLRNEVFSSIQHLRNGGSMRIEDLQIMDYSIVLDMLENQERITMLRNTNDWPYEVILSLEEEIRRLEIGLTEEEILTYIERDFHVPNPNETSTQNETCTICQEDYVEGETIGRLDCRHIYHLECIKQWLLLKNVCPICKKTALKVDED
ncbi:unnamed protein product [Lathyrus oleraceus]|uniref:uncharacterized protein LOC127120406 n=1 Tax=Pisum sativum TaxID=3888 RepID=UPI001FC4EC59|nr:uncharacterized protein LOC127120406 [Pisum sativum]